MPAPFKKLTLDQFAELLERFPFTRKVTSVHMHHTWRPNHQQFKGHESIVAMWSFHTLQKKWSDIAQHVTIDPEGFIWLGRNWNAAPASASGQNGDSHAGPFMFEMIGDFDKGRDAFEGAQRTAALHVVARVQRHFRLAPGSLMFHNMMSDKTCPGSSIDYATTLAEVGRLHAELPPPASRARSTTFPDDTLDDESSRAIDEALEDLARIPAGHSDPSDAEPCGHARAAFLNDDTAGVVSRDAAPTAEQMAALRPHLVNLQMGEFSSEGKWQTSAGDVDAIFDEHLEHAFENARERGLPLRIVFQAHGGLVNEAAGIAIARKSVDWWIANGVYPIYFVWETGAFETIGQLLRRTREGAARDVFDFTTDLAVQEAARALQGPRIWGGMKLSAQLASAEDTSVPGTGGGGPGGSEGGAFYVARKLQEFCRKHRQDVELHAVGHSAGAIFLAYFIPRVLQLGSGPFRSVHLLAPAIRTDLFKATLGRFVGPQQGVDSLTMYTMRQDFEKDDNCAGIYRKSLLYLIHHALEPQRKTPILGLEESVRADRDLVDMFGLAGKPAHAEVVWSKTAAQQGRSASRSVTHGGFDDDAATMGSIARRILGRADADRIVEYRPDGTGSRGAGSWDDPAAPPAGVAVQPQRPNPTPAQAPLYDGRGLHAGQAPGRADAWGARAQGGRRKALCVGIDRYPQNPLYGCVADVRSWTRALQGLGFDAVATLLDEDATRDAILGQLTGLIESSRSGDVIVFQYSGHGTYVRDLDGDEQDGDTPHQDEAVCPVDFATGALIVDDDIGRIFDRLPGGVNLTCFMDCCHSGTISRFGVGNGPGAVARGAADLPRFIVASPALEQAHQRYRERMPRAAAPLRGQERMREVVFSACLSREVAWESGGQGEFTLRATRILSGLRGSVTNAGFADLVTREFGHAPRQQPRLYSNSQAAALEFLAPLQGASVAGGKAGAAPAGDADLMDDLKQLIRRYERLL